MILGFVRSKDLANGVNVPVYLPQFQFYENHRAVIYTAFPEKILPVIASFDIQQDIVVKTLMALRQLPQRLRQKTITPFGLHSFTLLENTPSELCYGLRGQFWRTDFGLENVPDSDAWAATLPPGNAKLLLRYHVRQLATDKYELCTETFIYCPNRATHLKMAGYWLAIRAGSGWIRRRTLKAVKRQLEDAG